MKKQVAILGLTLMIGATAFAANPSDASAKNTSSISKVSATKVMQYKGIKKAQYTVVKGSKGYLYKQATLKTKVHSIKKYSKVKFSVSKEAIVRKANDKKAIYYYVKSSKVSGWIWHGYLAKVSTKKTTVTQDTSQQQIASLQQQISDLKRQISSMNNASQIADLQSQINSLKNSGSTSGSATTNNTTSNTGDNGVTDPEDVEEVDKEVTTDETFNGTSTEYYVNNSFELYLYPDSMGKKYPTVIGEIGPDQKKLKTLQIYATPSHVNVYDSEWESDGMVPAEYNGKKGYIRSYYMTVVPVDKPFHQFGNVPDIAGYGNIAPTDLTFPNPLTDGATWTQYSKNVQSDYSNKIIWSYNASTNTWKISE